MFPHFAAPAARRLDQELAGRPVTGAAPSDPYLAGWLGQTHASRGTPRVETGVVVDVAAGAYAYLVDAGLASSVWCSPGGTAGSFGLWGGRPLTTVPIGATVYFVRHPQTPTVGTIVTVEPHWSDSTISQPADGIWPFFRSGRVDHAHRFPAEQSAALSTTAVGRDLGGVDVIDFAAGRPLDATGVGEWGVMAETGVGVFADPFQAYLRIDEATGVFGFYADQLLRVAGQNYQFFTNQTEAEELEDEGELVGWVRRCVYPWEKSGLWRPDQVTPGWSEAIILNAGFPAGQGLTYTDPVVAQLGSGYAVREPETFDPLPAARVYEWMGYLGQGGRLVVAAPAQLEHLLPSPGDRTQLENAEIALVDMEDAPDGRLSVDGETLPGPLAFDVPINSRTVGHEQPGVIEQSQTLAGSWRLRAAKDIIFAKRASIPVPRQSVRPEDPVGDRPETYRPSGLEALGDGDEHVVQSGLDAPGGGPHRASMLPDSIAYLFNWEGLAPFVYHAEDWVVPEEGAAGGTIVNQQPHDYAALAASQYLAAPAPKLLDIDHRYGKVKIYETESLLAMLEDGTVVIGDGWGSEIRLTGGNIELHCAGDVVAYPGRSLITWAGHDVVLRAKDSVDLTAATGDVRTKAERNSHHLAGNSGCGGFLFESKAVCAAMGYTDRLGERVTSSGFTVLVPAAQFTVLAGDVAVALDEASPTDGRIYLDAGNSRHIHTRSRTHVTRVTMNGVIVQLFDGTGVYPRPAANEFTAKYNLFGQNVLFNDDVYMSQKLDVEGAVRVVGTVTAEDPTGFGLLKNKVSDRETYLTGEFRDSYDVELVFPPHTEDAEFSLRTIGQYLSTDYDYWQPRWRSIADADGQTLETWVEPQVVGLRSDEVTLPHPGGRWEEEEGYRYHEFVLVETADGWVAKSRTTERSLYEDPETADAPTLSMAVWYTVPVPAGTEI